MPVVLYSLSFHCILEVLHLLSLSSVTSKLDFNPSQPHLVSLHAPIRLRLSIVTMCEFSKTSGGKSSLLSARNGRHATQPRNISAHRRVTVFRRDRQTDRQTDRWPLRYAASVINKLVYTAKTLDFVVQSILCRSHLSPHSLVIRYIRTEYSSINIRIRSITLLLLTLAYYTHCRANEPRRFSNDALLQSVATRQRKIVRKLSENSARKFHGMLIKLCLMCFIGRKWECRCS